MVVHVVQLLTEDRGTVVRNHHELGLGNVVLIEENVLDSPVSVAVQAGRRRSSSVTSTLKGDQRRMQENARDKAAHVISTNSGLSRPRAARLCADASFDACCSRSLRRQEGIGRRTIFSENLKLLKWSVIGA